jgi:hypothetical protein
MRLGLRPHGPQSACMSARNGDVASVECAVNPLLDALAERTTGHGCQAFASTPSAMDRSTREEGGTTARALSMLQGRSVGTLRVVLSALPKRGDSNTAASSFGAPHEHATRVARSAQASSSSRSDHTGTSAAVPPPRSKSSNDATAGSRKSMFTSVVYPDFEPGCCDYSHRERLANLVTSVPFFFAGAHILR